MNRAGSRFGIAPAAAAFLLWGAAAGVGAWLLGRPPARPAAGPAGSALVHRLFSGSRAVLSEHFYLEADRYLHKGVAHHGEKAFTGLYEPWREAIAPTLHEEAEGAEINEIFPLLQFSVELDPENVESYLAAAYWIERAQGPTAIERVLREAERRNPADYRVQLALGRYGFRVRDFEQAAAALDRGLALWPSRYDPEDAQSRLDLAQMLSYRAALHERDGQAGPALDLYTRALDLFPDRHALARRVDALRRGDDTRAWVQESLDALFRNPDASHMQGGAPAHRDHHHDHDDDPDP
jgi:tetratricopeptide (TPR) repeat protein